MDSRWKALWTQNGCILLRTQLDCTAVQDDSPLQRLARTHLKQDPGEWVLKLRAANFTWQGIADDLGNRLGLTVSRETVRLWAKAAEERMAEVAS